MTRHPSLYQINTRVRLSERSATLGRPATLDDIADAELDELAERRFDWVWFLGIWQTGPEGRRVSLANAEWRREFRHILPDVTDDDICGSCFAVSSYTVHSDFGGTAALERLRRRVNGRGLRLLLDFVPNHTAPDHHWVSEASQFYVRGTEDDLARAPQNYRRVETRQGPLILAYGRDPYFPGWPDTLQLNYGNSEFQEAMRTELSNVARLCDGVRCDMAMLVLPEVFKRTWGIAAMPFWPAAIQQVRRDRPEFLFMAEVYWDLEWTLQQQGFDYTYDKRLYDRLRDHAARPVRDHLRADPEFQRKSARFLENHDEPRAAAIFSDDIHRAAAVTTFLVPGLRFFHQGQFEGRRTRIPVHLRRGPAESPNRAIGEFYALLMKCLQLPAARDGDWLLLECMPAWAGNGTNDGFLAFMWQGSDTRRLLVIVNYAPNQGQCYVPLRFPDLEGRTVRLTDLMGPARYDREGGRLMAPGLYLDMPAWAYHVFDVSVLG